jgi:hypothetical protein
MNTFDNTNHDDVYSLINPHTNTVSVSKLLNKARQHFGKLKEQPEFGETANQSGILNFSKESNTEQLP